MEAWESQYREELQKNLTETVYEVKTAKGCVLMGKKAYINLLVAARRHMMKHSLPAEEKKLSTPRKIFEIPRNLPVFKFVNWCGNGNIRYSSFAYFYRTNL